ncbi:apoptosis-enhancing nuclease [Rhinoderma darwinii]|uniref:apoptosis-enhancing nuclease n=1 Tax=Rhinoderma darwinii TaxID=43563 RepID=UPI003F664D4D
MEFAVSTGLFHGFPRSSHYLNASQKDIPVHEHKDVRARNRRKSRKHQRLLHKTFINGLLDKNESEERSSSIRDERSLLSCPQRDEDNSSTRLEEIKATFGALPAKATFPVCPPASDYDSGLSVADSSQSSRASSPISWLKPGKCIAIDCEMVGTGPRGKISELARCSVVDYEGDVLYDKYVKTELPVTDYRTRWSGITKQSLRNAISFKTARKEIMKLLKGKRVVGHALYHDFSVLKYFHPLQQTRDTSKITLLNQIAGLPTIQSVSLKRLALHILQKRIQVGKKGHSSVEDAQTCMELYRLVEEQVEQMLLGSPLSDFSNLDDDSAADNQYMDDQYWPLDLNEDCK